MSSSTTTMATAATHGIVRSSSFSSCGSEASPGSRNNSSSAMQLDDDEEDGNNDEKDNDAQHKTSQAIPIQTKPPSSQQPQPQQHRQVVSTSPAASSNVNELVSKAKKAASSLWLILHSQNCQISNCHHRGCSETKTLLVHVHSCHTTNCLIKGCNETKKLLGHYTKCKSLRDINENHSCLVCSLMARYAKSMLEREGGEDVQCKLVVNSNGGGEEQQAAQHNRQSSMTLMPPPPPRLATQQTPIKSCSTLPQHPSEVVQAAEPMSSKLTALAKVAAVLSPNVPSVNTSYMRSSSLQLGKSYDSSVSTTASPFSILKQGINGTHTTSVSRLEDEVMASISPDESSEQLVIPTGNSINNNRRRPRAESFDERKTRVKFAPGVTTTYFTAESPLPYANHNQYNNEQQQQQQLSSPNRPRSASCSSVGGNSTDSGNSTGNSSDGMGGNCETIVEEGVFVQQQKEQQAEQPIFDMD